VGLSRSATAAQGALHLALILTFFNVMPSVMLLLARTDGDEDLG
jgi:hypothetical protein